MPQPFINGYFQREPADGITVYHVRRHDHKIEIYGEYDTWDHFMRRGSLYDLESYSNDLFDFPPAPHYSYQTERGHLTVTPTFGPSVAYWNCDGSLYTTDQILGDIRECYSKPHHWYFLRRRGFGGGGWQRGKRCRITSCVQEKRQWKTWEDDDCDVHVNARARRSPGNLPWMWDEYPRQYYGNWKQSTKRKHQYKVK